MSRLRLACGVTACVALLCACSWFEHKRPANEAPLYMLYSPNGEPLNGGPFGRPTCKQALSGWFGRMAQDGVISQAAFLQDAGQQFARMDIDHNGYLVSEELDRFRAPYRQQPVIAPEPAKSHWHHKDSGTHDEKPSENSATANIFDPVMSADTNLDFHVTQEEFMKQAHDVFARLDADHNGTLNVAEVLASCPKPKE